MKVLYYDCFAGISGDMNLGALIDLGVPGDYLVSELGKLDLEGYKIKISNELKMGISGVRVDVILSDNYSHEHQHKHKDHHTKHSDHHDHRNLHDIQHIIEHSNLNTYVKEKSMAVFHEIAVAESKIHAKSINDIHFHEVGAVDSIVDIVGAAICIDYLKPDQIIASTIELGGGFVECAHGIFPVPAPATVEILKGIPVKTGTVDKETTTPTGAAILKVFSNEFTDSVHFSIEKTAYGIGHRDLAIPNVLRVFLGESQLVKGVITTDALLIECNIDDMNPELYTHIIDVLFEAGAQDVFLTPVIMKKSRPAVQLSILCGSNDREKIESLILRETTSLGIRYYPVTKSMLERRSRMIDTAYGPIRIKEGIMDGKVIKYKAEFDDCAAAAKQAKVSMHEIFAAVEKAIKH